MEFLVINESKLKIIMTPEDTERYEFSAANADYNSPDTRRIFWRIIDEAAATVGFDPKGDKILIQFYPSRDGGCEIFVTKLGALSPTAAKLVTRSENVTMLSREQFLYLFDDFEALRCAAKLISRAALPKSDAYETSGGNFFLSIEERGGADGGEYHYVQEFGKRCPKEIVYYVKEHYKCIAKENAIEKLAAMN